MKKIRTPQVQVKFPCCYNVFDVVFFSASTDTIALK